MRGFLGLAHVGSASVGESPPPLDIWIKDDMQKARAERIFGLTDHMNAGKVQCLPKGMPKDRVLTALVFLSSVGMIMNGDYVYFEKLGEIIQSLPVTQSHLEQLGILSQLLLLQSPCVCHFRETVLYKLVVPAVQPGRQAHFCRKCFGDPIKLNVVDLIPLGLRVTFVIPVDYGREYFKPRHAKLETFMDVMACFLGQLKCPSESVWVVECLSFGKVFAYVRGHPTANQLTHKWH
ncbi:hypothetical protein Q8A67_000073 [Cirrhinus molitorella]|uniref:Uncharacterized protein n=1 Tax=Cirrhinus molitorella TaxID=172907 RepID=A0AA88TYF5_9TELE|nr:hypothetical protein Q8A67_000073 [Cirrhinus molitorella]